MGAFQPETFVDLGGGILAGDRDPNSESSIFGAVDDINGQGAAIFLEVLRPQETPPTTTVSEKYTVSHEMGHLFNGLHPDGGLMALSGSRTNVDFSPITLSRIRSISHP